MSGDLAALIEEPKPEEGGGSVESSTAPAVYPGRWGRLAGLAVLLVALAALIPTVGDLGVTWDEPAYRYSQVISVQWWQQLAKARSWDEVASQLDPQALLYYWPYGRFGINFHPPFAGQLNLAAHAVFNSWMKDIPARRMATVIEFAITIAIGFQFLSKRYGFWPAFVMAGSLLLMPRLYGQAHLIDTDIPGLMLWAATALAFWKGLAPGSRFWRVAVGVLLGLAFVEKMGAVMVLAPLLLWLVLGRLPRTLYRPGGRADWIDGVVTVGAMLVPLAIAFQQILMLQQRLLPPNRVDLFNPRVTSDVPGIILAAPVLVWTIRRLAGVGLPRHLVWGVERPALEIWTAILSFGPLVGWLGNPAWWRETLPRLAHYYTLSRGREGVLPDIQILYAGQVYLYSLPWHNAWVLFAITVPLAILAAGLIGLAWALERTFRSDDRLPLYFVVHFATLPVIRMLPTPAHDGVRLFLPTFFFFAAFAGWGAARLADWLAWLSRVRAGWTRLAVAVLVLGSAGYSLVKTHPYELSYYNELVGGPRGAWNHGFELSYWYDAFNPKVIADLNQRLPLNAEIDYLNENTRTSVGVFQDQQALGGLRADVVLARTKLEFPYVWLLTQDSKASAFTRLLFAMRPWYSSEPAQLERARVATVADPVAVSRAWALQLLLDAADHSADDPPAAPDWVRRYAPWLGRFWGDGLKKAPRLSINPAILDWSRTNPDGLMAAAKWVAASKPAAENAEAKRLMNELLVLSEPNSHGPGVRTELTRQLLDARPQALVEAVQILNAHRDDVIRVMSQYHYADIRTLGGYLDRDVGEPASAAAPASPGTAAPAPAP